MLKNKKGFTLIEILAAITILGILMGIAIVSVTKVIENGKKKHYTTAEANMVLAGQSYVQQNRSQLPKAIGQKRKIPMTMLIEKNYIQPIKDYSDNECNMEKSYIQVFKYSQDDYSYVSYLDCPSYTSKETINNMTPEINASIVVDAENSKANAKITITGNDKLMSYSYIIYRNSKEVKNTGSVAVSDFAESQSINFSLADYTPGDIKLVITATNTYGNTKTKTVTENMPDTKKPKCVYLDDADKVDKAWTSENRKITVGCDDGETGSGCTRETYTKTFKQTADYDYITIEDEDGNKTQCKVSVFVDKIKPICTTSGASTKWTNDNRTIYWGCSDGVNQSGCDVNYSGGSTTFTTTTKTSTIASYTIKDNVGNTRTCPARTANVYVDKAAPEITSISNPTGGAATETAFALTLYGSDGHSGIGKWRFKYADSTTWTDYLSSNKSPFTTTKFSAIRNENIYISLCDAVGNCSEPSTSKIYIVENLCATTTTTWSNSWGTCTSPTGALCGDGTQTMTGTKYSTINTSHSCGEDSKSQPCDLGPCTTLVNETKYSKCDSYYITTCAGDTCTYTEKNGRPETGTISYSAAVDAMSSSCNKNYCSATLNRTDGIYTYYSISNCTVSSFGVTSGNNCSKGSKTSSNSFTVDISSAPETGKCPIWVETNEPYRIASGVIKYSGSWNTYYCGNDKFCSDSECSRWCVSK